MSEITAVSLFTGAGGMDIGFEGAGISVLCANELNKDACDTYSTNHPGVNLIRGDLTEHMDELKKYQGVDLVFGGPPCQGFSVAGKMDPNDERSQLIWRFLDVVELLRPKAFVMENVKALASLEKWEPIRQQYIKRVSDLGYSCGYWVLNASDYGVPQSRERVFFVGALDAVDFTAFEESLNSQKCKAPTLRELFQTLPEIGTVGNPHTCTARITLAGSPVMRKSPYAGMIFNGMGRPLNLDGVSATLPASMGGNKTPIIDEEMLRNPSAEDWVKEYHGKLWRKEIEAEFGPAPERLRRISIVESAAIQTFPRDYKFCGSKSAIYTQIGNAVPCRLAQTVATAVVEVIFGKEAAR
ncbi:MAG: DNA cytosine methyltransferase [Emergencia sp.]